jgi:hypothetical protein
MDGTFDQISQLNRIIKLSFNKPVFSFDLSKATDRFPIEILEIIIQSITQNEEFSKL